MPPLLYRIKRKPILNLVPAEPNLDGSCTEQNYPYSCVDLNDPISMDEIMAQKPFNLYGLFKMAAIGMQDMRGHARFIALVSSWGQRLVS